MQLINAVMLILGCSHEAGACQPVEVFEPYYETVQSCETSIEAQEHLSGEGYPVTIAKCIAVDNLSAQAAVKIDWHFNNNGVLVAYAGPTTEPTNPLSNGDVQLAANQAATQ